MLCSAVTTPGVSSLWSCGFESTGTVQHWYCRINIPTAAQPCIKIFNPTRLSWLLSRIRHKSRLSKFSIPHVSAGSYRASATNHDSDHTMHVGSNVRSWSIDGKSGQLREAHSNKSAHGDRITAAAWHAGATPFLCC